jgi:Holliday junction resolvase-like predicted endonuclease
MSDAHPVDHSPSSPRRTPAQRAGAAAEGLVAERLIALGWTVLGRNVHVGRAEIDLIAVDPGPPASLVVIEVRWRTRRDFGLPEETVDQRKVARIRRAAFVLRDAGTLPNGARLPPLPLRIDLVAVEPGERLRHHRHVG